MSYITDAAWIRPNGSRTPTSFSVSDFYQAFVGDTAKNTRPEKASDGHLKISEIEKVVFNDPATVVIWKDGTKTVVKCSADDIYDPEKGLAMAICKYVFGNDGTFKHVFKKWVDKEECPRCGSNRVKVKVYKYYGHEISCKECGLVRWHGRHYTDEEE